MLSQFKIAKQFLLPSEEIEEIGYREQILSLLKGKSFWIWNEQEHEKLFLETNGQCCFNHIVGLPTKDKKEYPLFDYEKLLYDTLMNPSNNFKDKHLFLLKATGLGATEFFLRLMGWLCTSTDDYNNSQMCIITGPNIDLATKLIKRLKGIFSNKLNLYFSSNKETVLELNGCQIQAYPFNHIDSYRSLTNPKFILCDEFDFIKSRQEQEDARHVTERYIGKSDPYIAMLSTPDAPLGLFETIEKEPEERCIYKRLRMDYTYGLGKIYSNEEIEKAKQSPSFSREYECKYLGKIGNVFSYKMIDRAIELGEQYSLDKIPVNDYVVHSIGIDPGFSSSRTAIVVSERVKEFNKIRVNECIGIERQAK